MEDAIGQFSLKHMGSNYVKKGNEISFYVSWEGIAADFGAVFGTLFFPTTMAGGGVSTGPCSGVSQSFLEDGTTSLAVGRDILNKLVARNNGLSL
jgi:hypothetical protein